VAHSSVGAVAQYRVGANIHVGLLQSNESASAPFDNLIANPSCVMHSWQPVNCALKWPPMVEPLSASLRVLTAKNCGRRSGSTPGD